MAWLAMLAQAGTLAAEHRGELSPSGLRWQTEVLTTGGSVTLAVPIPEQEVIGLWGARPIVEDGLLTGWEGDRRVVLETAQPDRSRLRPPLVLDADAPQEIRVVGQSFTPEPSLGFVRRLGWTGPPGVGEKERRTLRKHFGMGPRHLGALVLVADAPLPDGLPGTLRPSGARSGMAIAGVVLASLAAVAGLGLAYRRLERAARRERLAEWVSSL